MPAARHRSRSAGTGDQGVSVRGPRDERGVIAAKILRAARASFAQHGYAGTTLRAVAQAADVDPALVNYYFTNKTGLLEAVLVPPAAWVDAVAQGAAAPLRTRGAALVRTLVDGWSDPEIAGFLRSAILTAAHEPIALERLMAGFAVNVLDAVATNLPDEERAVRASLASTQLVGLGIMRYVWKVGAVATLSDDRVVALIGPTVQRYLAGKLPAADD
jgi:AcrR family transcriptional regulator